MRTLATASGNAGVSPSVAGPWRRLRSVSRGSFENPFVDRTQKAAASHGNAALGEQASQRVTILREIVVFRERPNRTKILARGLCGKPGDLPIQEQRRPGLASPKICQKIRPNSESAGFAERKCDR